MGTITEKDIENAAYFTMIAAMSAVSQSYLDIISHEHYGKPFLELDNKDAQDILADAMRPIIKGENREENMERFQNRIKEIMVNRINEKLAGC